MVTSYVDPGISGCGVSVYTREGALVTALYVPNPVGASFPTPARVHAIAVQVGAHCASSSLTVIERPRVYRAARSKGDPNDLITLALVVGGIIEATRGKVALVEPRAWKGTLDKSVMVKRIQARLFPEEVARVVLPAPSLQHNVWDAVGIGLWHCGRLERRRVVPR